MDIYENSVKLKTQLLDLAGRLKVWLRREDQCKRAEGLTRADIREGTRREPKIQTSWHDIGGQCQAISGKTPRNISLRNVVPACGGIDRKSGESAHWILDWVALRDYLDYCDLVVG